MSHSFSRRALFEIWVTKPKDSKTDALFAHILHEMKTASYSDSDLQCVKVKVKKFCQTLSIRWEKIGRQKERFLRYNASWLDGEIVFENVSNNASVSVTSLTAIGRPEKSFIDCAPRTKRRKVKHLLNSTSEELSIATGIQLMKEGKRDSAAIVKELSSASPNRGTVIKKARRSLLQKSELTPEQALALMVDVSMSSRQYKILRQQAEIFNCKFYPPYYKVKQCKMLCYPQGAVITEISAEIPVQSLINHTIHRLCQTEEVCKKLRLTKKCNFDIIMKWGCDGMEQNQYKQKFSQQHFSDESFFSISVVPLEMHCVSTNSKDIIWKNPVPSSTKYCRPLKFVFAKESASLITTEVNKINYQINNLSPTIFVLDNVEISVTTTLVFCMVDGKVCNAVSCCSSTQTCYLCGAKPTEMNNLNVLLKKEVKKEFLAFGISPLHSWIRLFECILHISYRLEIKTWQARGFENKKKISEKKKYIQEKFRSELGILVDMPKQQSGNTNDGNSARRFFRNPEKAAEITGVNLELIKGLGIILECINSGQRINVDKFEKFTKYIYNLYLENYSWYPMPVTLHKILFHGRDIIGTCILPIGQYSEEAQEARNKHNRQYREFFTRKTSRIDTNTDLLNRLLITSDPFIASLRVPSKPKKKNINAKVFDLLEMDPLTADADDEADSSDAFSDSE